MDWMDELKLITVSEPEERVNSAGFANKLVETEKEIFCNKKSVGYAEYYKSQQAGVSLVAKVEVYKIDYTGETLAEFEGKRCNILKSYELNDEVIELTLSDLREQAAESEA